ncbi:unnamed protein product [Allacma fusca]|uniref:DUF4806 domain-containing protein n=1 Tax=Allacma fusca TaxID=39272 RepID=A0A8J2KIT2_9HEXA|nr:unnamed protein product [Allacma fusca]
MDFQIVHFFKTNEVALVPSKWIFESKQETYCYWPIKGSVTAAVKSLRSPVKSDWKQYKIRSFHLTNNYDEGLRLVPHFERYSELESASEDSPATCSRSGRVLKRKKLDFRCSDSDDDVDVSKFCLGPVHIPDFPDNADNESEILQIPCLPPDSVEGSNLLENSTILRASPCQHGVHHCALEKKFLDFQAICVRNFAVITANQSSLTKMMESMIGVMNASSSLKSPPPQCNIQFKFPFSTPEDVLDFDSTLKQDSEYRNACVNH